MEDMLKNNGVGLWDGIPEGHCGSGNIDVRMKKERRRRGKEQHEERRNDRAQGQDGEDRMPAGLRGDMSWQRLYTPTDDGDKKEGGKRGRVLRGTEHIDKERQAFVHSKK